MRRQLLTTALGITCSAGLLLLACSSDEDTPGGGTTSGVDASPDTSTNPGTDSGGKVDGGGTPTDSGSDATSTVDATTDSGVDAGPTRTTEIRATGLIRLAGDHAQARFSEDDTIVRWSNAPGCISIVKSATKPLSAAGTVKIGGQIVNSDGGPTGEVELNAPDYYYDTGVVLPPTSEFTVDISEGPGNPAFPALPTQTIRPSASTPVTINGPLPDAGTGELPVALNKPVTMTWAVPTGDIADQRFALDLQFFPSGADGSKSVEVICDAALSTGTFTLPGELLADAVAQTVPLAGSSTSGQLLIYAGGQKIVAIKEALYVITAATDESTTSLSTTLVIK